MGPIELDGQEFWPGCYPGTVVDNAVGNGRVRIRIQGVYDDSVADTDLPPARAISPTAGNYRGDDVLYNNGDHVWVMFEGGDASLPVCLGRHLTDQEGCASNQKRTISGTDEKHVAEDRLRTIGGDDVTVVKGSRKRAARNLQEDYQEVTQQIIGQQTVTVGRRTTTVRGKDYIKTEGPKIWEVLGPCELRPTGNTKISSGGHVNVTSVGTLSLKGLNSTLGFLPAPAGKAVDILGINGMANIAAAPITGLPIGSQLSLDPLGLTTMLMSLALLMIQSPLIMLGMGAIWPSVNMMHTHIGNLGVPTSPAIPNPAGVGVCPSILMPSI